MSSRRAQSCFGQNLDEAHEVGQAARQSANLVDHNDVDPARFEVSHEAGECGPFEAASRVPAVVVPVGKLGPTLVLLARDVGAADLVLGHERLDVVLKPLVCLLRV